MITYHRILSTLLSYSARSFFFFYLFPLVTAGNPRISPSKLLVTHIKRHQILSQRCRDFAGPVYIGRPAAAPAPSRWAYSFFFF